MAAVAAQVGRTHAGAHSLVPAEGFVPLPVVECGPHRRERAVFDFALDDAQMAVLDALDEGLTTGWDGDAGVTPVCSPYASGTTGAG